jgi:hypothetical protein
MIRHYAPHAAYAAFLGGLLYVYATLLGGCGSAIGLHAGAAKATKEVNDTAVTVIETTCREKADSAARNPDVTTDQAQADAQQVVETCNQVQNAQHAFAAAHDVWVSFLLSAIADDEFDLQASLRIVVDLARLWGDLVPLTADFGIELPELPPLFTNLLGD